ncbi:hypothetical protein YC2023_007139 [Brassica napus]
MKDGAQWLVDNTDIKLVETILVAGLKLDDVQKVLQFAASSSELSISKFA